MIETAIPLTNMECAEICMIARKLLTDEIREYNTIRAKKAVETGKSLKKTTNKGECLIMIPSLKEEDGSITTKRERILERCAVLSEVV